MKMKIAIDDLSVGMYLHSIEGSWFAHPFWRRRFLVTEEAEIETLRAADIREVYIDCSKGRAPETRRKLPAASSRDPQAPTIARMPTPMPSSGSPRERAELVLNRSKTVMRAVFDRSRLGQIVHATDVDSVVDEITESMDSNQKALTGLLRLKNKDEYTYVHSIAVCALMIGLARHMGESEQRVREIGMAGLLHDIGKLTISQEILNKPGRLSEDEFRQVIKHAERGADIISQGEGIPDVAIEVCRHHHEKFDGTGYPDRLAGTEISLESRMAALCDVYDALTSERAYKAAASPVEALTIMHGLTGHFDPKLLFTFCQSLGIFPTGLLCRTNSNFLGLIVSPRARETLCRLRLFYDLSRDQIVTPRDVVIAGSNLDRPIEEVQPSDYDIYDWDRLSDYLLDRGDAADRAILKRYWRGAEPIVEADEPAEQPVASVPAASTWQPASLN